MALGLFSVTGLNGWEPLGFKKLAPTAYQLVKDGQTQVLRADCRNSASGYLYKGEIDLRRSPILEWRWKISGVYAGINEREKTGDDFPARVYVLRDGGLALWRTRSLVYGWASTQPQGSDWPNPYASQAHMLALQSGNAKAGTWQIQRRDLRADFKRYFDLDVEKLDGVALMSDCDGGDGRRSARAWYGDVKLVSR